MNLKNREFANSWQVSLAEDSAFPGQNRESAGELTGDRCLPQRAGVIHDQRFHPCGLDSAT